jgi:Na+-translocating ferredoxin:NAD+ oxidoreductase RnfG subunit
MRAPRWLPVPLAMVAVSAYATSYLSAEQARQVLFPGVSFEQVQVVLSASQQTAIAARAGVAVQATQLRVWRGAGGEMVLVDDVIGKHDRITYAVGINPDGTVKGVEIMDYRESYGHEVRGAAWRGQFVGKTSGAALHVDEDIRNISGATLSCRHVTDGVRRLLSTWEIALRPLAHQGAAVAARSLSSLVVVSSRA